MKLKVVLVALGAVVAVAAAFVRPPTAAAPVATGFATLAPHAGGASRRTPAPAPVVYVAGEVVRPGVVRLAVDARAADALAAAGGARPDADLVAVNLAAHVHDGDEIVVPVRGAPVAAAPSHRGAASCAPRAGPPRTHRSRNSHGPRASRGAPVADAPAAPVDINAADVATLATLPGIGPALAQRIVAYRDAFGPFATTDDLLDVAGITDRRLATLAPYVLVH